MSSAVDLATADVTGAATGAEGLLMGTVVSVDGGNPATLTATLSGSAVLVSEIAYLESYSPSVGDLVVLSTWDKSLIVLGARSNGGNSGVPTGVILAYPFDVPPLGYLACNGANVSRTTYARLFAVVDTTYGVGDGSTTFGLPNIGASVIGGYGASLGNEAVTHTHTYATPASGQTPGYVTDTEDVPHNHSLPVFPLNFIIAT